MGIKLSGYPGPHNAEGIGIPPSAWIQWVAFERRSFGESRNKPKLAVSKSQPVLCSKWNIYLYLSLRLPLQQRVKFFQNLQSTTKLVESWGEDLSSSFLKVRQRKRERPLATAFSRCILKKWRSIKPIRSSLPTLPSPLAQVGRGESQSPFCVRAAFKKQRRLGLSARSKVDKKKSPTDCQISVHPSHARQWGATNRWTRWGRRLIS